MYFVVSVYSLVVFVFYGVQILHFVVEFVRACVVPDYSTFVQDMGQIKHLSCGRSCCHYGNQQHTDDMAQHLALWYSKKPAACGQISIRISLRAQVFLQDNKVRLVGYMLNRDKENHRHCIKGEIKLCL